MVTAALLRKRNKSAVLEAVAGGLAQTRTEISRATGLSPATISTIVAGLLQEGTLIESGETHATKGRPQTHLSLNPAHGSLLVFRITRSGVSSFTADLSLNFSPKQTISDYQLDGDELFGVITESLQEVEKSARVLAIGIILEDDISLRDLNIMYSTSLSAESLPLEAALKMAFNIPLIIESFGNLVVSDDQFLKTHLRRSEQKNYAVIAEAEASAAVIADGKVLTFPTGPVLDLTALLENGAPRLEIGRPFSQIKTCTQRGHLKSAWEKLLPAAYGLALFFPLEALVVRTANSQCAACEQDYLRIWNAISMRHVPRLVLAPVVGMSQRVQHFCTALRERALVFPSPNNKGVINYGLISRGAK